MAKEKEHINLVFIGHVDHGKSTTVGRLLFDAGTIDEQTMRKLKEKAAMLGKSGFEFAFVMDGLKEEQERGVTIDLAHKKFDTEKHSFTIIDAPGHRDFIKNMITGASQADCAVLVVAANDGVNAQTKEHLKLSKIFGVGQLVVAVNKMDISGVDWSEERYKAVVEEVKKEAATAGWKADLIRFLPLASLPGDNIAKKTEKMPWWTGDNLLEAINKFEVPQKPTELPLRMPIQDVYNITGIGVVPVGRIETGIMKVGDKIMAVPGREGKGVPGEVKSIEMHHEQHQQAQPGDNVGINVRGFGKKDLARGDVLGRADNVPTVATEFTAQIVIMNHPSVVTVGYTPVFHIHTAQVACQFVEIVKKLNPATGEEVTENKDVLRNGDAAIVRLRPVQALVIEKNGEIPQMSRFAIRDSGVTVAAGMCIDVVKKDLSAK
ncbi:translation elongation factor EF-1 subunit alpha [Candidatus Woesearchaeota archaeon]|jgi:elongation factor 1-alpha|nr:translation elongation factor EF-1 subunit alpha [Candidatus Woesearchaeota archaeon]MBT4150621.1 translation elongation factor EF-1 subunit alpha [Candidatus Woesearchaeota archaeon]MBT4247839.1 translation elongation factor EF-1 subunit alpha [Candidatus Woesearchaeota archaeon]MBT4434263.1 translation elongation factor EF-1 subunit alpha [Candidatus Woesearchaeota archaeon]MBT7331816.1 translation elongation factor EF-1 subunit alpha [Candidatus Woesearchaeota archaeon]